MALKVIARAFEGFERAFARQAAAFRAAGGPEVEFEFLDIEAIYERMIAGDGCHNGAADVLMLVTDWYPQLLQEGALAPLDDLLAAEPPPDWPHAWSESLLALQRDDAGRVYGLPYHDGPEMLIYRKDLFEDPTIRKQFINYYGRPLEPPRTWYDFLETARFFHRPGEDLNGTVVASYPDAHNILYDFFLQIWTRGGEVLDAQGRPRFHEEIGVEALTFLYELMHVEAVAPPGAEINSVRSGELFAAGQVALMVNWMGFAAYADSHPHSQVRGQVACAPVPAGDEPGGSAASLNIYWCLSVPAGSRQREEAYRFLRWCARPEMDLITAEEGGVGVRRSTWSHPQFRDVAGYAEMEAAHAVARHLPRTPAFGKMLEILNEHVDRVLNHGADVEEELERAAERCAALSTGA